MHLCRSATGSCRAVSKLRRLWIACTQATAAPRRYAKWLDEIKAGASLRPYAGIEDVILKLLKNNPRLPRDKAQWLAQYWSKPTPQGFALQADPAHKMSSPILYRVEEVLACWRAITANVLLIESDDANSFHQFTRGSPYRMRLKAFTHFESVTVRSAGHMLHHDQPAAVAAIIESFMTKPLAANSRQLEAAR